MKEPRKMIHVGPEFFASESFATISPHSRLLSIALMQMADPKGLVRWCEPAIRAYAFPAEPTAPVEDMIDELECVEFLRVVEREEDTFLWLPGAMTVDS